MSAFLAYAEFQDFWDRFAPETPFGREDKDRQTVVTEPAALEAIWDRTAIALTFLDDLAGDPVRLDRITHHLKRLPRFPLEPRAPFTEVELFQFKKFLHNYTSLMALLDPRTLEPFGFTWRSQALASLLDTGRQSAESFYVADDYDPDLRAVRGELRDNSAAAQAERARRDREVQDRWGLRFGTTEFLVIARARLGDPVQAGALLLVEPFDETQCLVRPLPTAAGLLLAERREALLARERLLEEAVLVRISQVVCGEQEAFRDYQEAVRSFDLALARARLARAHGLTRPILAPGPIAIRQGRFLPCEASCRTLGLPYVPLDATFDTPVAALFGSNMGGKTVVLKTLAFLQLCVQTGLFAPAAAFTTRVFEHLHYVGEGAAAEGTQGLSGFGREIRQFNAVWADCGGSTLALFDEFARTTQSQEAEALLSAAMEAMAARPGLVALFSTHFRGIRRLAGVRYLRMRGLDRAGLETLPAEADAETRLRLISRHMDYRLAADDGLTGVSDALAVAESLGLAPAIARQAKTFLNELGPQG